MTSRGCIGRFDEATTEGGNLTTVAAGITTSLDGYVTGPNDGSGRGLGDGGERLHYCVFGGPWGYDEEPRGEPAVPTRAARCNA
jgi:hypothetical protein